MRQLSEETRRSQATMEAEQAARAREVQQTFARACIYLFLSGIASFRPQ